MELVERVAQELQLSHREAEGAVGALLWLVQHRLPREELAPLADCVPGFSDLAAKSPRYDAARLCWRGRIGKLLGGAGGIHALYEPLARLGIARSAAPRLVLILATNVREHGGLAIESTLRGALS